MSLPTKSGAALLSPGAALLSPGAALLAVALLAGAPAAALAQSCPDPAALAGGAGEAGENGESTPEEAQAAWIGTIDRLLAETAAAAEIAARDPARATAIVEAASDDALGRLVRAAGPGAEPPGATLVTALGGDLAVRPQVEALLPAMAPRALLDRAGALLAQAGTDYALAVDCGPTPGLVGDGMAAAAARGALLRAAALAAPALAAPPPGHPASAAMLGAALQSLLTALPESLEEGAPAPLRSGEFLVLLAAAQLLGSDWPG